MNINPALAIGPKAVQGTDTERTDTEHKNANVNKFHDPRVWYPVFDGGWQSPSIYYTFGTTVL